MQLLDTPNRLLILSLWVLTACGGGGSTSSNSTTEERVLPTIVAGVSENTIDASSQNYEVIKFKGDKNIELKLGEEEKDVYMLFSNPSSVTRSAQVRHNNKALEKLKPLKKEFMNEPSSIQTPPLEIEKFNNQPFVFKKDKKQNIEKMQKPISDTKGEKRRFYMDADSKANAVMATARKVVRNISTKFGERSLTIWVEDDAYGSGCSKRNCIDDRMIDALANKFLKNGSDNDIYDWVTNIFGEEWGASASSSLIEPSNHISILLADIDRDNIENGGVIGYFYSKDNFTNASYRGSNERIMFYIDSVMYANVTTEVWHEDGFWPQQIFSTLAHEFQHMIYFYHKNVQQDLQGTDTWMNEMLSEAIEDLLAVKMNSDGPRNVVASRGDAGDNNNYNGRYPLFNKNNSLNPLLWDNSLENYSVVSSFGAYLLRNYGGAKLLHNIVDNRLVNKEALMSAVHKHPNGASKSFNDLIHEWGIAILLSKRDDIPQDSGFLYNAGDYIQSEYDGVLYSLGSINFFNYTPQPTLHRTMGKISPQSNYFYKIGENLKGNIHLNIQANRDLDVSLVIVK